jgi:hypothetical protein
MYLNWMGALVIFSLSALMLILPRRYALVPIVAICCYMTFGQQLVIAGLHWNGLRIIVLCGWFRLMVRGETFPLRLNAIDRTLLFWVIVNVVAYSVLRETTDALINRLGVAFDNLGLYFFFRMTVGDIKDIERAIGMIALLIVPLAAAMVLEANTGVNPFACLGGVSEYTTIRNGILRCQGPFKHPILAGTFGAALIPLFVGYWVGGARNRIRGLIGLVSGTAIALASGASGPLVTYAVGVGALCLWRLRERMAVIRWGVLSVIISLHAIMNNPVWYLPERLGSAIGMGGTGWHRSYLIEQAIRHFDRWWYLGTTQTEDFVPYTLAAYPGQVDVTNQYILEGFNGGILGLLLFVATIVLCYRYLGRGLRLLKSESIRIQFLVWSLGAALTSHAVSFSGVAYFDQNIVPWFLLLAMISATMDQRNSWFEKATG